VYTWNKFYKKLINFATLHQNIGIFGYYLNANLPPIIIAFIIAFVIRIVRLYASNQFINSTEQAFKSKYDPI
jgi:cadmium resistance protein CadD (predicted permease)